MPRRTKIVATIGPASNQPETLRAMVAAGMDMARLSLAHGPLNETLELLSLVRKVGETAGTHLGVLADLPGPKVRAAQFPDGGVLLAEGTSVDVVPVDGIEASGSQRIAVDLASLLTDLQEGDRLVLGDGAIQLIVRDIDAERARAEVVTGGWAQGRPGVALPPGRFTGSSPTPEDLRLLVALAEADVDAVAISFVRSAKDIERARAALAGAGTLLVAKIETQEAVDDLDAIIETADGVMVARGDLGIRCALEDVPIYQKRIIARGVAFGRPVITATQMLETLVRAPSPTRAEVSDVANAVFDGTSALMLSGETAIGLDPVNAVRIMARIALRAEREFDYEGWGNRIGRQQTAAVEGTPVGIRVTGAISAAAWRAAADADVAAIIACTNTGATARAISRFRPTVPVLAATPSPSTARRLSMAWGITPVMADWHGSAEDIVWFAVKAAAESGVIRSGDLVAVLVGSPLEPEQVTDNLRLVRVQ